MKTYSSFKNVNPHLGTSFGFFTSAMIAAALLLAIFERLGVDATWLGHLMIAVPVIGYLAIGIVSRSVLLDEFYISGRRVPAFFNGLALATNAIGGVGFIALTGALFIIGFDAMAMVVGMAGGIFLMAILFAPYLRKYGAYTLPGYFRERYDSSLLRLVVLLFLIPPAMLLISAEFRVGAGILFWFSTISYPVIVIGLAVVVALSTLPGGMRGLTWTQSAQGIVIFLGLMTPLFILAIQYTGLPLPQLTYGTLLRPLAEMESLQGITAVRPFSLEEGLPIYDVGYITKPFQQAFGAYGWFEFMLLMTVFIMGFSSMPSLLMRSGVTRGVSDMRRSMGWGLLILVVLLMSLPAFAVFTKYLVLKLIVGQPISHLPEWFQHLNLAELITMTDKNKDGIVGAQELRISRDGILFVLPEISEYPFVIAGLLAAAGISASLAAAGGQVLVIANSVSSDFFHGLLFHHASNTKRLLVSRVTLVAVLIISVTLTLTQETDVLKMLIWALNLSASVFFPALLLSIWWRRSTALGIVAGMVSGFTISGLMILGSIFVGFDGFLDFNAMTASILAVPVNFAVAIIVSLAKAPSPELAKKCDEMRVAGGEPLFDKAQRIQARRNQI